jgi:hypothetical protein
MTFSWYARAMTGRRAAPAGRAAATLLRTDLLSAERNMFLWMVVGGKDGIADTRLMRSLAGNSRSFYVARGPSGDFGQLIDFPLCSQAREEMCD